MVHGTGQGGAFHNEVPTRKHGLVNCVYEPACGSTLECFAQDLQPFLCDNKEFAATCRMALRCYIHKETCVVERLLEGPFFVNTSSIANPRAKTMLRHSISQHLSHTIWCAVVCWPARVLSQEDGILIVNALPTTQHANFREKGKGPGPMRSRFW